MKKFRMMYLAGVLSLFVFHLGFLFQPGGLSDGGYW
jgi:hypothetical protein